MLNSLKKSLTLLFLLVLLLCPSINAQADLASVILDRKPINLVVDYSVFASEDPDKIRLEIYYLLYNRALTFNPEGDAFTAKYLIDVTVMDKRGKKVAGETFEKSITVGSEMKAKSSFDYRVSQVNFELEPNKYEVHFSLKDKFGNHEYSKEIGTNAKGFKEDKPRISNILFAQAIGPAEGGSEQFVKGNLMVVPSVSRSYGSEDNARLMYYMEIYPGEQNLERVTVQTLIRPKKGNMVYRDTLTAVMDAPVVRQLREISLVEFPPGEYELVVELQGRRGKKLDDEKAKFKIKWTEELLLEHNWKLVVNQIALIAEQKEIKQLEEAETLDERKAALKAYWDSNDPFPETPLNELKAEFYRRIRVANENFGYLTRPGWETDRGRVLVRYGVPNQIEDFPFSLGSYPYQEWHYYTAIRYRTFTFVDDNHDGDYRLVYPYDGLWLKPEF